LALKGTAVCRWLAYLGSPILLEDALDAPAHSLIEPRLHPGLGAGATNCDGFGVGWYGAGESPALFRGTEPAWNSANLREIAAQVTPPLFFAHIRASSGTAVQQTNCHPFRHGRWLFMHNGLIHDFPVLKRDLVLDIDPSLFPAIEGQTDSEVLFHLALTLGLENDPPGAVAGAVGLVEAAGRRRGVQHPIQMTIAVTDGERMWGFRYSSEGRSRSLFVTTDARTLRRLYPSTAMLGRLSDETHLIVSEPLGDLEGSWTEVPEASCAVVGGGNAEILPFVPPRSSRSQRPAHLAGSRPG
jgi:predicted glutamine amidotransferase